MFDNGAARRNLFQFVAEASLGLQVVHRWLLQEVAQEAVRHRPTHSTPEQLYVNYLRHNACNYEAILRSLQDTAFMADRGVPAYVLQSERRGAKAELKIRVLDEIARHYPWLAAECRRQKRREGVKYCRSVLSRGGRLGAAA